MRRTIIAIVALSVAASACSQLSATTTLNGGKPSTTQAGSGSGSGSGSSSGAIDPINAILASHSLVQFDACEDFLDYVKDQALDLVGPYGLGGFDGYGFPFGGDFFLEDAAALSFDGSVTRLQATTQPSEYSTTNVQELGVDEPDIVKTDGRRIVALAQQTLVVIDITGDEPEIVGRLALGELSVRDMFLSGDTVVVFGGQFGYGFGPQPLIFESSIAPDYYYASPIVQLVEIDIAGDPEIVRKLELDGVYINARMVGDTVRLISAASPHGFVWAQPEGGGLKADRDAEDKNRDIIKESTIDNWVPYFVLSDADGDVIDEGTLVDCDRARHPVEFAGLGLLSVVTIDAGNGLDVVDATGVLAVGDTVYASTDSLYVATQRWVDWNRIIVDAGPDPTFEGVTTEIHQFDISNAAAAEYVASGTVKGFLLNQFAMSEHEGNLRVASTTSPAWWGANADSESLVTILQPQNGELVEIGAVAGLGKGEQIFSVRFFGDVGYVVTFRQTDPLYTVDLSDPKNPRVTGELKILGYSAYLHPIGDDLLLGVGQDATEQGRTLGTQVSLFDVGDLDNPKRIAKLNLTDGGNSTVEYDHRAFLYWDKTGTVILPVQQYEWHTDHQHVFLGAMAVEVGGDDLAKIGTLAHPGGQTRTGSYDWAAQIQRSIVVGDSLYTISLKGVMKTSLDSLSQEAWVPFAT